MTILSQHFFIYQISCNSPSILECQSIAHDLKAGSLTPQHLAAVSVSTEWKSFLSSRDARSPSSTRSDEVWEVLAVNKFDSTRKRMSVLVRSPPHLGGILLLLCKGADSAMLDPTVCDLEHPSNNDEEEAGLVIQSHLGQFAREGLRTLVLAVRILPEDYGRDWIARHAAASASMKDRDAKLTQVAHDIEKNLHVVGITAIEDKLQDGVPETIEKLAQAGIKLWVLTGDKRETAIEIGYSTKVLTPAMTLFQVSADGGDGSAAKAERIRTMVAGEFMRLVKAGALPQYQKEVLKAKAAERCRFFKDVYDVMVFSWNYFWEWFWYILCLPCRVKRSIFNADDVEEQDSVGEARDEEGHDYEVNVVERRRAVRDLAEKLVQTYIEHHRAKTAETTQLHLQQQLKQNHDDLDHAALTALTASPPSVFDRASLAEEELRRRGPGMSSLRSISMASLHSRASSKLMDDDMLSLQSFQIDDRLSGNFDRKKRTILEKVFAVDRDVRHGILEKHLKPITERPDVPQTAVSHIEKIEIGAEAPHMPMPITSSQRALIVEGAALSYFLGDALLQEMLFAVASCSDAIIACRVSPKQKALLVKTVRTFVDPEPMTLAIGDGANDVGMIQEAHVGIGISGLEGQQAVNASDFSIAQFRFLEELLLIHGRWSFTRMARVVLFSFYKNAVLAGLLVAYSGQNQFSGTSLIDEWLISMFNFVCTIPILFVGLFDRDISKKYVRQYPQLYAAGPSNEELSIRKVLRWVGLTIAHVLIIYFIGYPMLNYQSTSTSAWKGQMKNVIRDFPGDGEGDFYTAGTATYTVVVFTLAYKASHFLNNVQLLKLVGSFLVSLTFSSGFI